ncbi:hypothetical protein [Corynebacterium alimapuense]|uniref:Uncharacterized protein n=1 Tax=Corynebacterium alimapuense TaxID=1576874 RepID=A0A3M8K9Q6_9CORY|nr:hypothetical protein [Corynebacterium alimapuense]RNE49880.1 hypothetical protein C5L39_00450 [Corynebacterium alimapuense]
MRAPRMRVGVIGDQLDEDLPGQLRALGHEVSVSEGATLADSEHFDLIVIEAGEQSLPDLVDDLVPTVRRGQIYLHTCLAHGVQILDPLETSGAVVIAAARLGAQRWAVTTVDELGQTIAELLIGELGGSVVEIRDNQRLQLAASMTYLSSAAALRDDAHKLLDAAIGGIADSAEIARSAQGERRLPDIGGPAGLAAQWRSIQEPGRARAFRQALRRAAEITQADDVELWAIQEEKL